jgi:hypothetical protein
VGAGRYKRPALASFRNLLGLADANEEELGYHKLKKLNEKNADVIIHLFTASTK